MGTICVPAMTAWNRHSVTWVRLLRGEHRLPGAGGARGAHGAGGARRGRATALVTTSMWQRGGCNNVAATSTWSGAVAGAVALARSPPSRGAAGRAPARCAHSGRAAPASHRAGAMVAGGGRGVTNATTGTDAAAGIHEE